MEDQINGVKVSNDFKEIVNESGAVVKELNITDNVSLRTWGNQEDGTVMGVYLYNSISNTYTEAVSLI